MTATRAPALAPLLATVFTMNLIEFLQTGMIVFASGPIMGEISASPEEYSIVTALYACTALASISQMVPLLQWAGWRRYVLGSLAVFAAGALVCSRSHDLVTFGAGRLLMAAGGGSFMTAARVLINLIPPTPQRLKGIAVFGLSLSLGLAGGPWVAASMVSNDQWHAMFYLLIVLAALLAVLVLRCLPADPGPFATPARFNPAAALSLLAGSFATLYALQRATYDFHSDALSLMPLLGAGLLGLFVFASLQATDRRPFLRLRELLNARYLFGLGVFTVCYIVLGATNVMLPVFIQRGLGVALEVAGKAQGIGFLGAFVGFATLIVIARKRPAPKKFYVLAFLLLGLFGWQMSKMNGEPNLWTDVVPPLALFGGFVTLGMATTALHAFRDLQYDDVVFANGQQLKNMVSQFGLGLGVACASVSFQQRVTLHYGHLSERFVAGGAELAHSIEQVSGRIGQSSDAMQSALLQLLPQLLQQSVLISSNEFFWALMWTAIVGALVMVMQPFLD